MWGKIEQFIMWAISYFPVLVIGLYRYLFEDIDKSFIVDKHEVSSDVVDILVVIFILGFTMIVFFNTPRLIFKKLSRQMEEGNKGRNHIVKKFDRLNLNDYTFFLLTLILPLGSVNKFV